MNKTSFKDKLFIVLAYMNRYVFPFSIIFFSTVFGEEYKSLMMGGGCIIFAAYQLVGYICRWKHIYCAYQNASHQKMTPHNIRWHTVKKSEIYGIPALFGILGIALIAVYFFYE